jgi:hypothetical protein
MHPIYSSITKRTRRSLTLICCFSVISACGGGGGGGSNGGGTSTPTPDTTAPTITLTGDNTVEHEAATTFSDPGASANDNVDGNITTNISVTGSVDASTIGSYTLTYSVSDAAGNAASQVTRTVNVVDTTPPTISVTGAVAMTIEVGDDYMDAGASATDTLDGDLSGNIVASGSVDNTIPGVYTITYNVSDATGNAASAAMRMVTVEDTTLPVISLIGDEIVNLERGADYDDAGATASDNLDGDISQNIIVTGTIDTNIEGRQDLDFDVADSSGNNATTVTRIIIVDDTTPPTIVGISPMENIDDAPLDATIEVTFSEEINSGSVNGQNMTVTDQNGDNIVGRLDLDASLRTVIYTPNEPLMANTDYTVVVASAFADQAGNAVSEGRTWTFTTRVLPDLPEQLSITGSATKDPSVAVNPAGDAVAAWLQGDNVWVNRFVSGDRWQGAEIVSENGDFPIGENPLVAISDNGDFIVAWENSTIMSFNTVLRARTYIAGSGFQNVVTIDDRDGLSPLGGLDMDSAGNAILVWEFAGNAEVDHGIYSRYYDIDNQTWNGIEPVHSVTTGFVTQPEVALNSAGKGMVVWSRNDSGLQASLFDSTLDPGVGRWGQTADIGVINPTHPNGYPEIDMNEAGKVVVAWNQQTMSNTQGDIFANWYIPATGWATATQVENLAEREARFASVAMNETDAVIAWTDYDGSQHSVYHSVLNEQNQLSTPTLVEDLTDIGAVDVTAAIDSNGLVSIVWTSNLLIESLGTRNFRILINSFAAGTTPDTSAVEVLRQASDADEAFEPEFAIDEQGNAIIVSQFQVGRTKNIQGHIFVR